MHHAESKGSVHKKPQKAAPLPMPKKYHGYKTDSAEDITYHTNRGGTYTIAFYEPTAKKTPQELHSDMHEITETLGHFDVLDIGA